MQTVAVKPPELTWVRTMATEAATTTKAPEKATFGQANGRNGGRSSSAAAAAAADAAGPRRSRGDGNGECSVMAISPDSIRYN